jgi:prevent-host-death family protein
MDIDRKELEMSVLMVPKSKFKPRAFAFLRRVEKGDRVCITDHGRPVVDIIPHGTDDDRELAELRGLVIEYDRPTDPVDMPREANA